MSTVTRFAAVACAAALLTALVGCSSSVQLTASTAKHLGAEAVTPASTPTSTPSEAPSAPPVDAICSGNPTGVDHIFVSIAKQTLWACSGPTLFLSTSVTTGASALTNVHDATPVGTWHIQNKVRNTVLTGHDANGSWRDPVAYWIPFDGPFGFHDASWQTFPFGSDLYTTQGSHGCVHVPTDLLGTIYNWAPVGTAVTIS